MELYNPIEKLSKHTQNWLQVAETPEDSMLSYRLISRGIQKHPYNYFRALAPATPSRLLATS